MRFWDLSDIRAEKAQARLHVCAVSPDPSLLSHTKQERRIGSRVHVILRPLSPLDIRTYTFK